jgi:rhodanese-related sulfurtransferase
MAGREPHTRRTMVFIGATLALLAVLCVTQYQSAPPAISPAEAHALVVSDTSIVLLDVRTVEEFRSRTGHIRGARLIPLSELERRLPELEVARGRTLVVYCSHGQRSLNGTALLRAHNFTAVNLEGGILKWLDEKFPVDIEE